MMPMPPYKQHTFSLWQGHQRHCNKTHGLVCSNMNCCTRNADTMPAQLSECLWVAGPNSTVDTHLTLRIPSHAQLPALRADCRTPNTFCTLLVKDWGHSRCQTTATCSDKGATTPAPPSITAVLYEPCVQHAMTPGGGHKPPSPL
jgi:hypothetical protein